MATESSLNPIAVLVHLLAIAVGLLGGWRAMEAIAPDRSDPDAAPGVSSSSAPRAVAGDDPDSLFRAENLAPALNGLEEQLPAGEGLVRLRIEPGSVSSETAAADGTFEIDDVSPSLPAKLGREVHRERERVTLHEIGYMELVATRRGPRWYLKLDVSRTDVDPPWTYGAPLAGSPLTPGPLPPKAIAP